MKNESGRYQHGKIVTLIASEIFVEREMSTYTIEYGSLGLHGRWHYRSLRQQCPDTGNSSRSHLFDSNFA